MLPDAIDVTVADLLSVEQRRGDPVPVHLCDALALCPYDPESESLRDRVWHVVGGGVASVIQRDALACAEHIAFVDSDAVCLAFAYSVTDGYRIPACFDNRRPRLFLS